MSDFIHSGGKTQALHPQAHAGLSRHDHAHERGNREGVAVRHGSASSSLNPFNLEHQERNATLV